MFKTRSIKTLLLCTLLFALQYVAAAQNRTITGKVTDKTGSAIPGATIQVKGTQTGTTADGDGTFKLSVANNAATLIISFIGYTSQEVSIANKSSINIQLSQENTTLTDVVVVGYGTTRKKDLTGAIAQVKAADFNKGITTAPDQLIQGKVSGLMILNNNGAPGASATVRIRGVSSVRAGNQPLYVVDGVPLDGRVARPSLSLTGLGQTPDANPLNFINSFDIATMEVLKDASATAIYGSRGSNGVVIITTKKAAVGPMQLDVNYSVGQSSIMKKLNVLNADEYRAALKQYNQTGGDGGSSSDGLGSILRTGITQNVGIAMSGGNETGRYRASFGLMNQEGIVKKSGLKKYTATLSGQNKFLESQKLGVDYNIMAAQTNEQLAPISNNAGFTGSLVGQALQWNPTDPLYNADGSFYTLGVNQPVNPALMSAGYDDNANISFILGSISPYFKFNDHWELRTMYSVNHQIGQRRAQLDKSINIDQVYNNGIAAYNTAELNTQLFNSTLTYNNEISKGYNLTAMVGYEVQKFEYSGVGIGAKGFPTQALKYYDQLQSPSQTNTFVSSFRNPESELQSFFGRATINAKDKYILTATMRADGSNKFGANHRYGYFPSFAAKWNTINESFLKGSGTFSNLALRVGYGTTGNQEFPAGAAQSQYTVAAGSAKLSNVANPDLQWETSKQLNIGVDFGFAKDRLTGTIDYFLKNTSNLLFSFTTMSPAPASTYWINFPGKVVNTGVEISLRGQVIQSKDWSWSIGVNGTYLKNKFEGYTGPVIRTGSIDGQGVSDAFSQRLENGYPLNTFYLQKFEGFDDKGNSIYAENGKKFYLTNPNPKALLGINSEVKYKRWSLSASSHGAFGFQIYNNTANTVLPINNLGSRNVAKSVLGNGESKTNSPAASSRFLENGNFLKLDNITLSHQFHIAGKVLKNPVIYVTGQNLFVLTKYTGFDPEVNTDKNINGVSSFGIEYIPYPTARSVVFGVSFSL
ncbi:SusC/RagA family TonB-linked outer membrane protein [Chitinophaga silvatica]|uniref:SusC/RagA family TonB-linked outer membrane protein n=1 Tax=Chitinophaga silvatica TaxID=2282649 RepID=A0A3E1YBX4_9BACT|nr:SusC/RagA family TonB-linked outer membrane protein [Chitinophaga silvatica]RFS23499.1 SusC/RagA family TonB-linked outer membrane protein [Chitinophaga silvatica]